MDFKLDTIDFRGTTPESVESLTLSEKGLVLSQPLEVTPHDSFIDSVKPLLSELWYKQINKHEFNSKVTQLLKQYREDDKDDDTAEMLETMSLKRRRTK